jgi:hypothetical protein
VAIAKPANGEMFLLEADIEIVADVLDPDGYVPVVAFFANGRKIGESRVDFIREPDPGQPQTFSMVWHAPPPGRYVLTARALDAQGGVGTSEPITISVGENVLFPVVTVVARDAFAVEPALGRIDLATFRIRRTGPTNEALAVVYSLSGTAENGIDYEQIPSFVTVPAGQRGVDVVIRPRGDNLSEEAETVILRLMPPPPADPAVGVIANLYQVGRPGSAVAVISDTPWEHDALDAKCAALPGRLLHLCFAAQDGHFRLEASPNLLDWETVLDAPSVDGACHFIDELANQPHRFYRLAEELTPLADE